MSLILNYGVTFFYTNIFSTQRINDSRVLFKETKSFDFVADKALR